MTEEQELVQKVRDFLYERCSKKIKDRQEEISAEDLLSGYIYMDQIQGTEDSVNEQFPWWCGWALRQAFVDGMAWQRECEKDRFQKESK